jgi:hypothetical protein
MVPMRTSTVFKSRWMALVWAAGIIWFAYDFAGSQPQHQAGDNILISDTTGNSGAADDDKIAQALGN